MSHTLVENTQIKVNEYHPTEGVLFCAVCGADKKYHLPMSVDAWLKMVNEFQETHSTCQAQRKPSNSPVKAL